MDTKMLIATGLTQSELAAIYGVSRPTINFWMNGRFKPHQLHREKVEAVTAKLTQALADNKLPLPEGIPKHQRVPAAQSALAAV